MSQVVIALVTLCQLNAKSLSRGEVSIATKQETSETHSNHLLSSSEKNSTVEMENSECEQGQESSDLPPSLEGLSVFEGLTIENLSTTGNKTWCH
jgi:hypothetical protein